MGLTERIAPWALDRPRLYVVCGPGGRFAVRGLDPLSADVADSPRDADILVVAGEIPDAMLGPLRRAYAAIPTPRAALRLGEGTPGGLPYAAVTAEPWTPERVLDAVVMARRGLFEEQSPLAADDAEAGGGMEDMPAGRPMADTGPDPDDLWLDRVPVHVGPLHPGLPSGLEVRVVVQGDRVVEADVVSSGWARVRGAPSATDLGPDTEPFARTLLGDAQRISSLESARAASHLRWAAGVARLCGIEGPAARLRGAAALASVDAHAQARLRAGPAIAACERWGLLRRRLRGTALIDAEVALGVGGPVARAAGVDGDERSDDPAYRDAGFEPVTAEGGDAWARWWVRTREALASLELAGRARGALPQQTDVLEGPRGPLRIEDGSWARTPSARAVHLISDFAVGCGWSELIDGIASLDIDADEVGV